MIASIVITGGWVWTIGGARISMRSVQNPLTAGWLLIAITLAATWKSPFALRLPGSAERALLTRLFAWATVAFVVLAAPLIYYAAVNASQGRYVTQTYFWRSAFPGVDATAFALGNPFHPLLRPLLSRIPWFDRIEGVAWLGAAPLALLFWRRRGWS